MNNFFALIGTTASEKGPGISCKVTCSVNDIEGTTTGTTEKKTLCETLSVPQSTLFSGANSLALQERTALLLHGRRPSGANSLALTGT